VYSSFIVKQNLQYFSKEVLHAVLLSRFGERPAGHWVVMVGEISGVQIMALAYAWSMSSIAYIVSSCGKTVQHTIPYTTKFEDTYGEVGSKELPCPAILHTLFEFHPSIDEHNKQQQGVLSLETTWLTKFGFTCNLFTFTGMSVMDLQRWNHNNQAGNPLTGCTDNEQDISIKEVFIFIARPLGTGMLKYERKVPRQSATNGGDSEPLTCIRGQDGSTINRKGRTYTANCVVCGIYSSACQPVNWMCRDCGMPLCNLNWSCTQTCLQEHTCLESDIIICGFVKRTKSQFKLPEGLKKLNRSRGGKAKATKERHNLL
jgi:hypothetical protein